MPDWYSPSPSPVFHKKSLTFVAGTWLDTSYNGELLVLSGAPHLQVLILHVVCCDVCTYVLGYTTAAPSPA
eukprot:COSAG01_NODE_20058_length_973_cov_2.066362_1_plen_70_part_10